MANTNDPGEAAVPAGYMLGEGWEVSRYSGRTECDKMGCGVRASVFLVQPPSASIHARCPAHAVEMGALVPIEPPVAEPGARCRVCGYYETSLARATERYAHCPACGRAPHWIPVGDDDVRESVAPVAEPAQPVCKYCVWWKESARGKLCVKCGKVYGGRVGTRSDDPPPVPPGPVPVETEGYEDSQGRWVIRKPATAAAPAKAPPEGEPVGTPPPCHERCGEVFLRGTATYCADVLGRKPTDPCHCHLTEYTVTVYCTAEEANFVKVWGPDMVTQMEDGEATSPAAGQRLWM